MIREYLCFKMKSLYLFGSVILVLILPCQTNEYSTYSTTTDVVNTVMSEENIADVCKNKICVRKCCAEGEYYDLNTYTCVTTSESEKLWTPVFHSGSFEETAPPKEYMMVHGFPCDMSGYIETITYLMTNGELYIPSTKRNEAVTNYCKDLFFNGTDFIVDSFVCFPEETSNSACRIIRASLLVVSATFLLITVIVYLVMPELRANLHGKVLISYVIALLVSSVGLAVIQLGSQDLSSTVCKVLHIMIHYFMLSAFFWLNTMSYDVWRSLRSLRPQGRSRSSERKRLIAYSLYSWGCPLVISIVTLCVDTFTSHETFSPSLGAGGCWFYSFGALWIYLYSSIVLIMLVNVVFYVDVARILWVAQKSRQKMLKNSTVKDKERMKVYFKLFIVMGITWIFEILSATNSSNKECDWWIITDVINASQGLFIFLVFICKRSTINKLKASLRNKNNTEEPGSNWNSKQTGTSSINTTSSRESRNVVFNRDTMHREAGIPLQEPLIDQSNTTDLNLHDFNHSNLTTSEEKVSADLQRVSSHAQSLRSYKGTEDEVDV